MRKQPYIIGIIITVLLSASAIFLFDRYQLQLKAADNMTKEGEYRAHYVLITKDMATSFWQSVYESAKNEAVANNIYIEQIGSNLSEKYSMEDYLRISIASKVDGIIICPDESDSISELINEAADNGIPVVTILKDDINTKRVSFVGLNSVELGLVYGTQIYNQITKDTRNIYILMHSSETNSMNDMIFNQIKKTLNEKLDRNHVNLQPYYISDVSEFDSEEAIRDIFVSSDIVPDMLVCMDEVDTECACQAIVDYNKVGDVTIIGSYTSDVILEAIHKKLAALTVAMDTEQLGKQSVQALLEYQEMGYVNNYYNVDLHIINYNNVNSYIDDQAED